MLKFTHSFSYECEVCDRESLSSQIRFCDDLIQRYFDTEFRDKFITSFSAKILPLIHSHSDLELGSQPSLEDRLSYSAELILTELPVAV